MKNTFLGVVGALLACQAASAQTTPAPAPALTATALAVGDAAPMFTAKDAQGHEQDLKKMLKKGPVVLYFYRGQWCPYCNKQLSQLQDSLQQLTAKGAQVLVVSPEIQENIGKTVAKTKASFPIVHDENFAIMKAYHTAFTCSPRWWPSTKASGWTCWRLMAPTRPCCPCPPPTLWAAMAKSSMSTLTPTTANV